MTGSAAGRIVRWPLWSWRNLTVTAVLALALLAVLGRLTNDVGATAAPAPKPSLSASTPPSATTTPSSTAPAGPAGSTSANTRTTEPSQAVPTKVAAGSPVAAATAFVTAWSTTTGGETAWLARMKPWASASLLSSLSGTDPTQVPATRVTGDAALTSTKGKAATVSVPTDGGRIAIGVVNDGGKWKANTLAPDDAPPGAPTPALRSAGSSTGG